MTYRMPGEKHRRLPNRLQRLAESQGVSLNTLVGDFSSLALAQFDAETRFRALLDGGRHVGAVKESVL